MSKRPSNTGLTFRVFDGAGPQQSGPARQAGPTWDAGPRLAIEAKGVTVARGRRVVLRDVDFAVAAGEVVAVLGANGAGKTTLLECLAGAMRPIAGEVLWLGEAVGSPAARRVLGYLPHGAGLYLEFSAWENLVFAGRLYGVQDVSQRAAELLAAVGLRERAGQRVHRLSLGMRRRLALARAVIHDPPILLLDEPFANLDTEYRRWLAGFLDELRRRGRAICLTSHDPARCRDVADRLVTLQAARLCAAEDRQEQIRPFVSSLGRA